MAHVIALPDGHVVSDERARLDMDLVHAALAGAYWARERPRALAERSWAHCLAFGAYAPGGALAGFGRVLTDYAFRAHVADVMVLPASRGRGLGRALIGTMLGHPALATVSTWTLTTADAQELYARFGFRVAERDGTRMVLNRR
jgi:GNAT superfamily N-acetyltransferase